MPLNAVLITDEKGKRYIANLGDEMTVISNVGTIRSELLATSLNTGGFEIGGKKFTVRKAAVQDLIAFIERKAQILTPKDIATIIHLSDVHCGSKVIEGGAGSGALTIALLASVGSSGSVTTYETRNDFAEIARRNIQLAGLSDRWTLKHADICEGIDLREVDAVIVDIPNPWDCIKPALDALRKGARFCAFVPNINQVEKTVRVLREHHFTEINAVETLQREMVIHERGIRPSSEMLGHTGYVIVARQ